jgi:hypothetical protein
MHAAVSLYQQGNNINAARLRELIHPKDRSNPPVSADTGGVPAETPPSDTAVARTQP